MAAVVTVSQRKVDTLIIAKLHSSADQCTDRLLIIADRVAHILDFSAVAQFPESAFQILFLNRSHILCYMAVEAVAYVWSVRDAFNNAVHLTELLYLKSAEAFCRSSVNGVQISVLFFKLIYFVVNIFQNLQRKLSVLTDGFAVIKLLKLIQRSNSKRGCHRL